MKPDRSTTAVPGMEHIGEAFMKLRDMNLGQREQLADEVHAAQANLFYSILVLNRYGASFVQLEVVLNILFQERCLTRLTGRLRFIEGLTPEQQGEVVSSAMADHSEPWMLAFAFGELRENGMLGITTDAEKYLVLAALNLVECVAEVART